MNQCIEVQQDGAILCIQLNRPDKLNALNQQTLDELLVTFKQCRNDKSIRGILIIGSGKAFCSGADIHRLAELDAVSGKEFALMGQQVARELETLGKPSLAAINGFAIGGGCELAMAASMRIASCKAKFAQPEVKLGVIPGYGGTQRLARLIGKGRAIDLCITGRQIDAQQALAWGLVSEVTEADVLLDRAKQILLEIASMAPIAVASTLQSIDEGFDLGLEEALQLEALHFSKTCATRDKQEGVSAFLEKREAKFQGE